MVRIKKNETKQRKTILVMLILMLTIRSGTASVCSSQYSTGTSTVIQYVNASNGERNLAVTRLNSDNSIKWAILQAYNPAIKSIVVDSPEQYVYFALISSPDASLIQLNASDGSLSSSFTISSYLSDSDDIKIFLLPDNTGYYLALRKSSNPSICQYLFASSNNANCIEFSTITINSYCHLMINSDQLFLLGIDSSVNLDVHFYKVTFSSHTINWGNKVNFLSTYQGYIYSENQISNDYSKIYALFIFEATSNLFFLTFNANDGSVTDSKYKSNLSCNFVFGSTKNSDYLLFSSYCSPIYVLILYNTNTSTFSYKNCDFILYGISVELSTGRILIGGKFGNDGVITKFLLDSINQHPDFTTGSLSMNIIPAGFYNTALESGITNPTLYSPSTNAFPYPNSPYAFNSCLFLNKYQEISVKENSNNYILPDLPCTMLSSTTISFNINNLNGGTTPSWIVIDSNTGMLTIKSPEVSADTDYYFSINSSVFGISTTISKTIKLTVRDSANDATQTAKALSISVQSIIGLTILIVTLDSLINSTSMSNLWSLINQMQIYFLLLLTKAYIPYDIQETITGTKFVLDLPYYFSFNKIGIYNSVISNFDFALTNPMFGSVGLNSDSTIYNISSFFITMVLMLSLHLLIVVFNKLLTKCNPRTHCLLLCKITKWIVDKLYRIFTFSYYIRFLLEMNQYMLISSIYEIYSFDTSKGLKIASLVFAMVVCVLCMLILIVSLYLSLSPYTVIENAHNKLGECFTGLKMDKKYKIHSSMIIIRRTVFVLLLIVCSAVASRVLIGVLTLIQVLYLVYICILRPFKEVRGNLIEILNEVYFLSLLSCLIYFNTESYWSSNVTSIYMWVLASNSMTVFIIIICKLFL